MSTLFSSQWWCAEVDLPFLITGWCQGLRIILSRRWRCSTSTNANGLTSQRRWCFCIGFPDLWPCVVGRQVPAWSHFKSKHCCGVGVPDLLFCDYWLIRIALDLSGPLCWGGGVSSSWFCFFLFLRGSLDFTLKATVITFWVWCIEIWVWQLIVILPCFSPVDVRLKSNGKALVHPIIIQEVLNQW